MSKLALGSYDVFMSDDTLLSDGGEEARVGFATALQDLLWAEAKRREGIAADGHPHSVNALRPDSPLPGVCICGTWRSPPSAVRSPSG